MQVFEVEIDQFENRRQVVSEEKGKWRMKWFEDEEKIVVYLVDLDTTLLKAVQLKRDFADSIDERNFRNTYCDKGMRIKREL